MARVICVDYEAALARRDVPAAIFERFAPPRWRELRAEWLEGSRSRESYLAEALRLVEAPAETVVPFARQVAELRSGLPELWDWAHWRDWTVVVLADGFDFYVMPSLEALGLSRLARYAARTTTRYRWQARYYSPRGIELQARFKLAYVAAYRRAGDFVVYVGAEGAPEAAAVAHVALARQPGVGHATLPELGDAVQLFEEQAERWWRSWSSTIAGEDSSNGSR